MPGIVGPGGGRIGTLVLGRCVRPGSTSDTPYNHYSMLRSVEDMLGITQGGSDGAGHLGYAGADGLVPFGTDVFGACGQAVPVSAPRPLLPQLPTTGGLSYAVAAALAMAGLVLLRRRHAP
jgi:hypothetical protein